MSMNKKYIIFYSIFFNLVLTQTFSSVLENVMDQKPLWTGSFGTVSIDGQTYNQISLRPEFNLGNWGMGFDFYLYIDGDGNIYNESWNFSTFSKAYSTIIDKLKYVRYGYPGDKLYFKVGSLTRVSLGHGILVDEYSNMMRYPEIRKVGLQAKYFLPNGIGIEYIQSDFKNSPSLIAGRIDYPLASNFSFGLSAVTDINQNASLEDSDGDDTPDFIDTFPNNSNWQTDTDEDGLSDQDIQEFDIDGDGWDTEGLTESEIAELQEALNTINELLDLDGEDLLIIDEDNILNPDRVITFEDLSESITGVSIDFTYHINENFKLYSEFAKLMSSRKDLILPNGEQWSPGYGLIPIALKGHYGPLSFKMEYRKNSEYFMYNFWNRSYDLNRSIVNNNSIETKASQLYNYGAMEGLSLNVTGNILNIATLGIGYQDLKGDIWNEASNNGLGGFVDEHNRSLLSNLSLNTVNVPKVRYLNGFYQKTNVRNPFDIQEPDQNTIYGYDLGLDISESMVFVYKSRTSYQPDGQGGFNKVNSMFVETQILF